MLIHSASQCLTLEGGPQRGGQLGRLTMIEDGAVLIDSGTIAEVGRSQYMLEKYPHVERWDARGGVIMPGLVDPHTHAVWAGDRAVEFEMRVAGKTYQDIMRAGGGIVSTVRETRRASAKELREQTRKRLDSVLAHGTTTLEAKTGYGLDTETELKMLQVLLDLDREHPLDLVMTFLGAHAVPPEYAGRTEAYTDLVCAEMIPALAAWWPEHTDRPLPFVDVFCERGVFDYQQSRRILETAREWGFPLKIHADEFENLGGAALAVELGAASADHLVVTSAEDIQILAGSDTAAVALPCTPFGLGEPVYTPADDLLKAGGLLAIATDLNPGTAWCENMQFAIALSCRYMKLTPAQAIAAATINAAAAIGQADRVGSLEVGKQGDVLILAVQDYRHLGYRFGSNLAAAVIKKGRLVWQKEEI